MELLKRKPAVYFRSANFAADMSNAELDIGDVAPRLVARMPSGISELRSELGQMLKSGEIRPGTDLTKIGIPASFMLPFSTASLSLHASALDATGATAVLGASDPVGRMLRMLSGKLAVTSQTLTAAMMKPYNPIIGEVCIACSDGAVAAPGSSCLGSAPAAAAAPAAGDSSDASWRAIVEQVSHHPPITASALEGESHGGFFRNVSSTIAVPMFYGNYVEVRMTIYGSETTLTLPGGQVEVYRIKSLPSVYLRGVMGVGASFCEWAGVLEIECAQNGLVGRIDYKPAGYFGLGDRHVVKGTVTQNGAKLCQISGKWTRRVVATMASGAAEVEMLPAPSGGEDRPTEIAALQEPPPYGVPAHSLAWERHPSNVWGELTAALKARDWNTARAAKATIEEGRRVEAKAMRAAGEKWETSLFYAVPVPPGKNNAPDVAWLVRDGAFKRAFDPTAPPPCKPMQ